MSKFTVLLLYPDHIASNYGQETCLMHVKASSPEEARVVAQKEASEECGGLIEDPSRWFVLFIAKGHLNDLNPGE